MRASLRSLPALLVCLLSARLLAQNQPTTQPAVHDFARWEKDIAAFEAADRANPPPKGAWLFTGSSTIRLWKTLAQGFPGHTVLNRGFGGSYIVDATHFAERYIFPVEPDIVFLRAGGNDLWGGLPVDQVVDDFKAFAAGIHGKLPQAQVVFISLSPSVARWKQADKEKAVNDLVRQFASRSSYVKYIETFDVPLGSDAQPRPELFIEDKLHFNEQGYKLLLAKVQPQMPK